MAKRALPNEKPFTALDKGLAASVMNPVHEEPQAAAADTMEQGGNAALAVAPAEHPPEPAVAERPAPRLRPVPNVTARQPVVGPKGSAATAHPEKLSREKRVLLTPSEEREIERCVDRVAEGFGGTAVKLSHIVRACLTIVRHGEGEIIRRAQEAGQLTRPPNGDVLALAEFEHELAKVLSQAFRDAPALR